MAEMGDTNAKHTPSNGLAIPKATEVLRALAAEGHPVTTQRRQLVDAIIARSGSFTADDLATNAREVGITVGRATLFRTLDLLVSLGFLSRVADGDRLAYTVCDPIHHHHLVCADCGQVVHLDGCLVSDLLQELASRTGYRIMEHRLDVAGICPACHSESSE